MKTTTQTVVLKSENHYGKKPPAGALGEVLRLIQPALRYSVRMAFEGRSSLRGAKPAWLDAASDVRFLGHDGDGDTTLTFEVRRLGDAAPNLYAQQEIWSARPDPGDTGFDLLADVVREIAGKNADSEKFDNPLLCRIGHFDHALGGASFQALNFISRRRSPEQSAAITQNVIETAKRFSNTTPPPQAIRIYGTLDMVRASTQSFALKLDGGGGDVHGVLDNFDSSAIGKLLQRPVVVLGKAVYRPSGRLLRIDATEVRLADESERFFSKVPSPKSGRIEQQLKARPSRGHGGVAAIFGRWPGDETDDEVDAALKELG